MIEAVIDANNVIVNMVVSGKGWTPPRGTTARDVTDIEAGIGWTWPVGANSPVAPPDTQPHPALKVTARAGDFLRALIELGLYDKVDAAVKALPSNEGKLAQVLWARAASFERNHPLVIQIATALGVDLDALFTLANSYR